MTKESVIEILKQKGLRITPQRLSIIDVLVNKGHLHPGARFIYDEAKKKGGRLSLSSVYENIEVLCRHGIIKSLEFDGSENRCEANLEEHVNLVCEGCGKIVDYNAPASLDRREVAKKTGFTITDNRLEYYGRCGDCMKGKGRTRGGGK
jgi:Fur family peroxide stress response transcriptional regulator